jgi:hypothetical protein
MGGADGKVAYIGLFNLYSCYVLRQAYMPQIPKAPSALKEFTRLQNASVVCCTRILYHLKLNFAVDPEQACDNISYARAQNSEVN